MTLFCVGNLMRRLTGFSLILLTFAMLLSGCEKASPEVIGNYSSTSAVSLAESTSQNTQQYQFSKNNNATMVSFGFDNSTMSLEATRELKQAEQNLQLNPSKSIAQIDWTKAGNYIFDDSPQTGVRWLLITGGQK